MANPMSHGYDLTGGRGNRRIPGTPNVIRPAIIGGTKFIDMTLGYTDEDNPNTHADSPGGLLIEDNNSASRKYGYLKLPYAIDRTIFRSIYIGQQTFPSNTVFQEADCYGPLILRGIYSAFDLSTLTWNTQGGLTIDSDSQTLMDGLTNDSGGGPGDDEDRAVVVALGYANPNGFPHTDPGNNSLYGFQLRWDTNSSSALRRFSKSGIIPIGAASIII